MNFYDLFEAKKDSEKHQDVTIADPKAALALKQARNKYSYADSDLEAFVKMVQDEQDEEQSEIDDLEAETAKQEELIQRNIEALQKNQENIAKTRKQAEAAKERADQLERENKAQNHELSVLRAAKAEFDAISTQYDQWMSRIKDEVETMQAGLAGVETPRGAYRPSTDAIPDAPQRRRAEYVPPEENSVLSRRLNAED